MLGCSRYYDNTCVCMGLPESCYIEEFAVLLSSAVKLQLPVAV